MRQALIPIFLFFLSTSLHAQQTEVPCFTDEMLRMAKLKNPALVEAEKANAHSHLDWKRNRSKREGQGCEVRVIPTVFHIVHENGSENISDQKVLDLITEVNDAWRMRNIDINQVDTNWRNIVADMKVELRLAKYDEEGNATNGIVRIESELTNGPVNRDDVKTVSMWDPSKYLNIWVVRNINSRGVSGTVLGYAYFPFMESKTTSGIVIRSDVLGRNTLPHELGHYLDLYHPFQGSCGQGSCLTSGDQVCDTPPTSGPNYNCPKGRNSCSNDSPDGPDMIVNIMDYSNCRNLFTLGQKERVDKTFADTDYNRGNLISIENLRATGVLDSNESVGAPVANFSSSALEICEGETVEFTDLSCTDIGNTDYQWFFPSGQPSASFSPDAEVTYNRAGVYDVKLIINNDSGADTLERTQIIKVVPKVSKLPMPLVEQFGNDEFPYANWSISGNDHDISWEYQTEYSKSNGAALGIKNYQSGAGGSTYTLSLPPVNMTEAKSLEMSFDLAYSERTNPSGAEELKVIVRDPCLGIEAVRYHKLSRDLTTVDERIGLEFRPDEEDWRKEILDFRALRNSTSLQVQFIFTSFGEQNIFIDNISVGGFPVSVKERQLENISLYPNPAENTFQLKGTSHQSFELSMFDLLGRSIELTKIGDSYRFSESVEPGTYVISVFDPETGEKASVKLLVH